MSLPVDLRNVPNAVFNSKLIALHIPSMFPVKVLRLISVWIIVFLAKISSISLFKNSSLGMILLTLEYVMVNCFFF